MKENKTLNQKIEELEKSTDWFYSDDFNLDEAVKKYNPKTLKNGYNTVGGEEIYYISNPALGLWTI